MSGTLHESRQLNLEPCPFCGGEARAFYDDAGGVYEVQCQECGAEPYIGSRSGAPGMRTLGDVIEAWNRRSERVCHNTGGACVMFECSGCGCVVDALEEPYMDVRESRDVDFSYCPNCGAKVARRLRGVRREDGR